MRPHICCGSVLVGYNDFVRTDVRRLIPVHLSGSFSFLVLSGDIPSHLRLVLPLELRVYSISLFVRVFVFEGIKWTFSLKVQVEGLLSCLPFVCLVYLSLGTGWTWHVPVC